MLDIRTSTSCAGVIGHPIAHSMSPLLHNKIYRILGLDAVYTAFDVADENFPKAIEGFKALGYMGFNVTIPYKEKILELLDEVDEVAAAIGAVNTVKLEDGKLKGYNTDGLGFIDSMALQNIRCRNKRVLIIGAGGAARSIAFSLIGEEPREILILNRSMARAKKLIGDINAYANSNISGVIDIPPPPTDIDIIINTTPVGMWPKTQELPIKDYRFNADTIVCDIVYNPQITLFLQEAKDSGCLIVDGLGMLVGQGIRAIEIWTDKPVEDAIMRRVLKELRNK